VNRAGQQGLQLGKPPQVANAIADQAVLYSSHFIRHDDQLLTSGFDRMSRHCPQIRTLAKTVLPWVVETIGLRRNLIASRIASALTALSDAGTR